MPTSKILYRKVLPSIGTRSNVFRWLVFAHFRQRGQFSRCSATFWHSSCESMAGPSQCGLSVAEIEELLWDPEVDNDSSSESEGHVSEDSSSDLSDNPVQSKRQKRKDSATGGFVWSPGNTFIPKTLDFDETHCGSKEGVDEAEEISGIVFFRKYNK